MSDTWVPVIVTLQKLKHLCFLRYSVEYLELGGTLFHTLGKRFAESLNLVMAFLAHLFCLYFSFFFFFVILFTYMRGKLAPS